MKRLVPRLSLWALTTIVLLASSPMVAASSGPKATKTVTYLATQDATVSSARPDANFGEGRRLSVRSHDPVLRTYIRFDLHRPIDPGRIVGAVLTLTSPTGDRCLSDIRDVDVYTVGDGWREDNITFNTAPAPVAFNTSAGTFGPGQVVFDVTADFTETDVATYYLKMPADCDRLPDSEPGDLAGATKFKSSESTTGEPTLEVGYCRLNHSDDYC
jgi:hypothetical protein